MLRDGDVQGGLEASASRVEQFMQTKTLYMTCKPLAKYTSQEAPDVFQQFGVVQQFRVINHLGIMAVPKLLAMRTFLRTLANFTQGNLAKRKAFDPELARHQLTGSTSSCWRCPRPRPAPGP